MPQELENRNANIRVFEYTSGFHLLTEPREVLAGGEETRRIRIQRSEATYVDGELAGDPEFLYEFEVSLEDFSQGLGGISGLENKLDNLADEYKNRPITPDF